MCKCPTTSQFVLDSRPRCAGQVSSFGADLALTVDTCERLRQPALREGTTRIQKNYSCRPRAGGDLVFNNSSPSPSVSSLEVENGYIATVSSTIPFARSPVPFLLYCLQTKSKAHVILQYSVSGASSCDALRASAAGAALSPVSGKGVLCVLRCLPLHLALEPRSTSIDSPWQFT